MGGFGAMRVYGVWGGVGVYGVIWDMGGVGAMGVYGIWGGYGDVCGYMRYGRVVGVYGVWGYMGYGG